MRNVVNFLLKGVLKFFISIYDITSFNEKRCWNWVQKLSSLGVVVCVAFPLYHLYQGPLSSWDAFPQLISLARLIIRTYLLPKDFTSVTICSYLLVNEGVDPYNEFLFAGHMSSKDTYIATLNNSEEWISFCKALTNFGDNIYNATYYDAYNGIVNQWNEVELYGELDQFKNYYGFTDCHFFKLQTNITLPDFVSETNKNIYFLPKTGKYVIYKLVLQGLEPEFEFIYFIVRLLP